MLGQSDKHGPIGIRVLAGFVGNGQAGKVLNPDEAVSGDAGRGCGGAAFHIAPDNVSVECDAAIGRGLRRDVGVFNLVRVKQWQLCSGSRVLGADRLLPIKYLGGVVITELACKSGGSFGIASELLVVCFDSVGCGREVDA